MWHQDGSGGVAPGLLENAPAHQQAGVGFGRTSDASSPGHTSTWSTQFRGRGMGSSIKRARRHPRGRQESNSLPDIYNSLPKRVTLYLLRTPGRTSRGTAPPGRDPRRPRPLSHAQGRDPTAPRPSPSCSSHSSDNLLGWRGVHHSRVRRPGPMTPNLPASSPLPLLPLHPLQNRQDGCAQRGPCEDATGDPFDPMEERWGILPKGAGLTRAGAHTGGETAVADRGGGRDVYIASSRVIRVALGAAPPAGF